MLEMVHYILKLIVTMKHVIYGAILSAAMGSLQRKSNSMHFNLKIWHLMASIFHFPKKIFSPDLSLTTQIPWLFPVFTEL